MPKIAVKFQIGNKQQPEVKIKRSGMPPLGCGMVKEGEKDRRIVQVLRKYLDLQLTDDQLQVFNKTDFVVLGELLYELVFNDENAKVNFDDFYQQSIKDQEDQTYDILLEFGKEPVFEDLAILPWEYIYYKPQDKILQREVKDPFLAADSKKRINFYRKYDFTNLIDPAELQFEISPQRPLRILLIIADPLSSKPLGLKMNVLFLFQELIRKHGPLIDVRYLPQPNYDSEILLQELQHGRPFNFSEQEDEFENPQFSLSPYHQADDPFQPDIIHFVGHGKIEGENGLISLIQQGDDLEYLEGHMSDEKFASCIENAGLRPKLVFLQMSNGGKVVNLQQDGGVAPKLLKIKVPYVITMQNPIQEDKAFSFSQTFYQEFLSGKDIGSAVTSGRFQLGQYSDAVSVQNYAHKAFGSPVLFTTVDIPFQISKYDATAAAGKTAVKYLVCPNQTCINHLDHKRFSLQTQKCPRCQTMLVPLGDVHDHGKAGSRRTPDSVSQTISSQKRQQSTQPSFGTSSQSKVGGQGGTGQNPWGLRLQSFKEQFLFLIESDFSNFFEEIKLYLVNEDKLALIASFEAEYRGLKTMSQRRSTDGQDPRMNIQQLKVKIKELVEGLEIYDFDVSKFAS